MSKKIFLFILLCCLIFPVFAQQKYFNLDIGSRRETFTGADPFGVDKQSGFFGRLEFEMRSQSFFGLRVGLEFIHLTDQTFSFEEEAPQVAVQLGFVNRLYLPVCGTYNIDLNQRLYIVADLGLKPGIVLDSDKLRSSWTKEDTAMMQTSAQYGAAYDFRYLGTRKISLMATTDIHLYYRLKNNTEIGIGAGYSLGLNPYLTKEIKYSRQGNNIELVPEKHFGNGWNIFLGLAIPLTKA